MSKDKTIDMELLYKVVGQLYLESRFRVEQLNQEVEKLKEERDSALKLLYETPNADNQAT